MRAGVPIEGANLLIRSTVPDGSGLSSSAALEVSSALAFLDGREFDQLELAKLCQRAERNFVGMPCGIMDQYISVFGRAHSAVEIDCRSLGHRLVTAARWHHLHRREHHGEARALRLGIPRPGARMRGAVEGIAAVYPRRAESARRLAGAVRKRGLAAAGSGRRRARHVVTEDARVNRFVEASAQGDVGRHGQADGGIASQPAA